MTCQDHLPSLIAFLNDSSEMITGRWRRRIISSRWNPSGRRFGKSARQSSPWRSQRRPVVRGFRPFIPAIGTLYPFGLSFSSTVGLVQTACSSTTAACSESARHFPLSLLPPLSLPLSPFLSLVDQINPVTNSSQIALLAPRASTQTKMQSGTLL